MELTEFHKGYTQASSKKIVNHKGLQHSGPTQASRTKKHNTKYFQPESIKISARLKLESYFYLIN